MEVMKKMIGEEKEWEKRRRKKGIEWDKWEKCVIKRRNPIMII